MNEKQIEFEIDQGCLVYMQDYNDRNYKDLVDFINELIEFKEVK